MAQTVAPYNSRTLNSTPRPCVSRSELMSPPAQNARALSSGEESLAAFRCAAPDALLPPGMGELGLALPPDVARETGCTTVMSSSGTK